MTKDTEIGSNLSGKYRNEKVRVGDIDHGGVYTPPKNLADIKNLMKCYVQWINSNDLLNEDPSIRAAMAHYHLALIHPFRDGNGRTARLVETLLLKSAGIKFVPYMLSNFYYKNIDEYFYMFSLAEKNKEHDITDFLKLVLNGIISSLEELQGHIFSWIRGFVLKEFYSQLKKGRRITQRQFDLLVLLLEFDEEFSLNDLLEKDKFQVIYRGISERTVRRDVKKLLSEGLLSAAAENKFKLNKKVIG